MKKQLVLLSTLFILGAIYGQADYSNAFLQSGDDPAAIEYDNIVSTYHSTMTRQSDGRVLVWGEKIGMDAGNVAIPRELNSENYIGLTGKILRFAGGSYWDFPQFVVLTTTGLFVWGEEGRVVHEDLTNSNNFQAVSIGTQGVSGAPKADGLPDGVSPTDVKMLMANHRVLSLLTNDGNAWILSRTGNQLTGDGISDVTTGAGAKVWHRVKKSAAAGDFLTGVIALRVSFRACFALTGNGELYTWGSDSYLGNNTAGASRTYATLMTLPVGLGGTDIKMIGVASVEDRSAAAPVFSSYYILSKSTAGSKMYSLGLNSGRQLGNYSSTTIFNSWVRPQKSSTSGDYIEGIVWISPKEHDSRTEIAVNVLTSQGKLWSWGWNDYQMIGGVSSTEHPILMTGGLASADRILAVETGGHTTIVVKECDNEFGYIGHRVRGSMGDGTIIDAQENIFNFSQTAVISLEGASPESAAFYPMPNAIPEGEPFELLYSPISSSTTFEVTAGAGTISVDPGTGKAILTPISTGSLTVAIKYNSVECGQTIATHTFNILQTLPVALLNFSAIKKEKVIQLMWSTASELSNKGFEIERSTDGRNWIKIGFVRSLTESTNSSLRLDYTFTDNIPSMDKNYYRLKQIDSDEKYEYSPVRMIDFNGNDNNFRIYPNPVQQNITIEGLKDNSHIELLNIMGETVQSKHIKFAGTYSLDMSGLRSGFYFVKITGASGTMIIRKVTKK